MVLQSSNDYLSSCRSLAAPVLCKHVIWHIIYQNETSPAVCIFQNAVKSKISFETTTRPGLISKRNKWYQKKSGASTENSGSISKCWWIYFLKILCTSQLLHFLATWKSKSIMKIWWRELFVILSNILEVPLSLKVCILVFACKKWLRYYFQ